MASTIDILDFSDRVGKNRTTRIVMPVIGAANGEIELFEPKCTVNVLTDIWQDT